MRDQDAFRLGRRAGCEEDLADVVGLGSRFLDVAIGIPIEVCQTEYGRGVRGLAARRIDLLADADRCV